MADQDERPKVVVYYVDAGGGHRAAARALEAAAAARRAPFHLEIVNLQEVLAPLDPLQRLTSLSIENAYNALLRTRRTGHLALLLRVLHAAIRLRRRALVERIACDLEARSPGAVVSVMPNFNGVLRDAVAAALPGRPFVVVLTDFADMPPHFWIESGVTRVVVATDRASAQAAAAGLPPESVYRSTGMLLHPRFYGASRHAGRWRVRRDLGLRAEDAVVLLMFGAKGSEEISPLAASLLAEDPSWHVVALCGDNPRLLAGLGPLEERSGGRLHALGFTERVADHLAAADVLVTKPGPGALAEAFHQRVPVVVCLDRRTIPQERYNAHLVSELGLGVVVGSRDEMAGAAAGLAHDAALRGQALASLARLPENRAVFEVLDLIASSVTRPRRSLREALAALPG